MADDAERLTFERLRQVQREEKGKRLPKREPGFYRAASELFRARESEFERDRSNRPLLHEIDNVRQCIKDIYNMRESKIVLLALNDSRSNSVSPEVSDMLPHEKRLYGEVVRLLNDHRDRHYEPLFRAEPSEAQRTPAPGLAATAAAPAGPPRPEAAGGVAGLVVVEMADDVPRTLGADGVEYGPFQRGERARLPALNAEILIKRGKARAAQVSQ